MKDTFESRLIQSLSAADGPPEELLLMLGGAYHYRTDLLPGQQFSNGDLRRAGYVFLIPEREADGTISISLYGIRMTAVNEPHSPVVDTISDNECLLDEPVVWTRRGILDLNDGNLVFRFEFDPSKRGYLEEYVVNAEPGRECPAEFVVTQKSGSKLIGRVCHSKLAGSVEYGSDSLAHLVRFRSVLSDREISRWGQRLYNCLSLSEEATHSEPYVLIDIVYGSHRRVSEEERFIVAKAMLSSVPQAVLYCVSNPETRIHVFGKTNLPITCP